MSTVNACSPETGGAVMQAWLYNLFTRFNPAAIAMDLRLTCVKQTATAAVQRNVFRMLSYRASCYTAMYILATLCLDSIYTLPRFGVLQYLILLQYVFCILYLSRVLRAFKNKTCHYGHDTMGIELFCPLSSHL